MKIIGLLLVFLLNTLSYADSFMLFALGYKSADSQTDRISIGSYTITKNKLAADAKEYDAILNSKPAMLSEKNAMSAPYGNGNCQNRSVEIPTFTNHIQVNGSFIDDGTITVLLKGLKYVWKRDSDHIGFYILDSVSDSKGNVMDHAVGYAFNTESSLDTLSKTNFFPTYSGNIFHKNARKTINDDWEKQSTMLKPSMFTAHGNLLEYDSEGSVKLAKPVWSHNTLALNQSNDKREIYNDYGHDFNRNGCYDEYGHNKVILAGLNKSSMIDKMVFIEYSYNHDGYPMLSVGRYYQK